MDEGVTHLKSTVHTLLHSSMRQTSEPEHQTFEVPVGVQNGLVSSCLSNTISQKTDFYSWTSQDPVLGGWTSERLVAISRQDQQLQRSTVAESRKRFVFSYLRWDYQSSDDGFFFSSTPYSPATKSEIDEDFNRRAGGQTNTNKMDRWTTLSILLEKRDEDRLLWKMRQMVVSICLFWHFSSVKILMNKTLCSNTQWPHGTSQTTAAGEPKR